MTMHQEHGPAGLQAAPPDGEGSRAGTGVRPRRMPAGGWLREIATSENWRTTTIVQRHRDRAISPPSL